MDDITIAATKEVTDLAGADLNKNVPTHYLGEVTRYMGSEKKRYRNQRTLEFFQAQYIRFVVQRLAINKTSPIPASSLLDLRHVSDEDPVVDPSSREMVGSLM